MILVFKFIISFCILCNNFPIESNLPYLILIIGND